MRMGNAAARAAIGFCCLFAVTPVMAQSTDSLSFQLNNATTADGTCQLTFVIENNTGTSVQKSSYSMAIADSEGRVNLATLTFQPLPTGKRRVQQFVLKDQECEKLSGLFINGVTECVGADGTALTICDEKYAESSRIPTIQFPWQP